VSDTFTLRGPARLQQEIRKSRFVAQAATVDSPERARDFVMAHGDAQATHNCWAYRIGQQYRFSDDGEPGGTAGRPILQAIDGRGFDRVVVLVTRWYGGIKLGAGGLARAYGGCASECLRLAERVPVIAYAEVRVLCEFAVLPILLARCAELSAVRIDERAEPTGMDLHLRIPRDRVAALDELIRNLSRGRARMRVD
jgi:uncharacterized YigZ family protein